MKLLWKGQTQRSLRVPNELDYLRPRAARSLCCSGARCFTMKLTLLTFAAGFISADAMELIVKPSRIATAIIDLFIFYLLSSNYVGQMTDSRCARTALSSGTRLSFMKMPEIGRSPRNRRTVAPCAVMRKIGTFGNAR